MSEKLELETQAPDTTEPLPVEEQINQELVKHNVTEAKIAELKEKYLPLEIKGIDDKETYLQVKEARKECKALRVAAEKICKFGREEANRISKAWVAKEKDVAGRIGEVEDHLEKQEKEFEAAVAKEKEERKRKIEEQFIHRNAELNKMGVLYTDGNYYLGEVSFELSLVKECETEIWEESILPKFKEEYEKAKVEELEKERVKREKEAELKRQQEEMEQKKKELEEREAAIKKAEEDELNRKAAEAKAKQEAQQKARADQLHNLGLKIGWPDGQMHYVGFGCFISHLDILTYDEEKWDKMMVGVTEQVNRAKEEEKEKDRIEKLWRDRLDQLNPVTWDGHNAFAKYDETVIVASYEQLITWNNVQFEVVRGKHQDNAIKDAEEKEQKRLAEIEAQKEAERVKALRSSRIVMLKQYGHTYEGDLDLGKYPDKDWNTLLEEVKSIYDKEQREKWEKEQKEKRQQEEKKKAEELLQATEKQKWADIINQVKAIEVHDFKSGQYRKRATELRKLLDQIKAL